MSKNIPYNWQEENGFFYQKKLYDEIIKKSNQEYTVVELGCCQKSTYYLMHKSKLLNKYINIISIGENQDNNSYEKAISCGNPNLINIINSNYNYLNLIANESIDCLYLNEFCNSNEIIKNFKSKIKKGGMIAGNFFNLHKLNKTKARITKDKNNIDLFWEIIFN